MKPHVWLLFLLMPGLLAPAPGKAQLVQDLTRPRGSACCPTIPMRFCQTSYRLWWP
jgi:hypothetical protein